MAGKTVSTILFICMIIAQLSAAGTAISRGVPQYTALTKTESRNVQAKAGYGDTDSVRIIVQLGDRAGLSAKADVSSSEAYRKGLILKQNKAIDKIAEITGREPENAEHYTLLFNGFSFDGTAHDIDIINAQDGMRAFAAWEFENAEPCMTQSASLVGAPYAWESEYSGKGTAIAVLDTGIRASHEAFSVNPPDMRYDEDALSRAVEENNDCLHCGVNVAELYKSGKIPFGYNYANGTYIGNQDSDSHGTHVAGIAAGNNGAEFRGIAYDAQIFAMKVFADENAGATADSVIGALEDCVYLGVDVINMSFGSPCGSCSYADEVYESIFSLLDKTGISVSAASGNNGTSSKCNRWYSSGLTQNPDEGVVNFPSTYYPCVSVASSDNREYSPGYILSQYYSAVYQEPENAEIPFISLDGMQKYMLCGNGNAGDFPSAIQGRIALVGRSDIPYDTIAENAYAKGAVGVILYHRITDDEYEEFEVVSHIPFVTVPYGTGDDMIRHMNPDGTGDVEVVNEEFGGGHDVYSTFSSHGTTSELKIKPELTAPGGNIVSADGAKSDKAYTEKSGTSMAAAQVSGCMAVMREYIRRNLSDVSDADMGETVNALLFGSAKIMDCSFVTMQGAGLVNLKNALSCRSYLTVDGMRPLIELDESEDYRWEFDLEVTNLTDDAVTYDVTYEYFIPSCFNKTLNGITVSVFTDSVSIITRSVTTECDSTVTVAPGEMKTLHFSIDASKIITDSFKKLFPNGTTIEGYIILRNGREKLSAPLLGFLGDWDRAAMFDRGFYLQEVTGERNMQSNGNPDCLYNYAGTEADGRALGIGFNPFIDMDVDFFNPDWGAVSPNGDGVCDSVNTIRFGALRTFREFYIDVNLPSDAVNLYTAGLYEVKKDYYDNDVYSYHSYDVNYDGEGLSEGETAYITVYGTLGHDGFSIDDNECARWEIPVTLDTKAPTVSTENGTIAVYDEHYAAYAAVYDDEKMQKLLSERGFFPKTRGSYQYVDDVSGTVYMLVGDYAGNTALYCINTDTGEVAEIIEPETFTVRFVDWDETVLSEQTVEYGRAAQEPQTPCRDGYVFIGWDKPFDCVTEDMTIKAVYDKSILTGDMNGDGKINTADAVVVLKHSAGMMQLDGEAQKAGDCNRDGKVNTADAVLILKYAAGMISGFQPQVSG